MKRNLLQKTIMVFNRAIGGAIPRQKFLLSSVFAAMVFLAMTVSPTGLQAQISYSQDFQAGLGGWSTNWSASTLNPCGGTQSVRKNIYSVTTSADFLSPSLGTSNGGLVTLSFVYKLTDYLAPYPATPATFGTINVQHAPSASGPWTTVYTIGTNHVPSTSCATIAVPAFSALNGPLFVRFNCVWNTGDYYLHFDDISVTQGTAAACASVSAPAATPTSSGASISWTESGTATAWDIQYGLSGFTLGSGTTVAASSNPSTITGLSANTSYSYYVRANCGGNGTSIWNGPFNFTTLCGSQLSGTVSVNPGLPASSTNFQSLTALASELNACGVSGPLTVNIAQGTYNERISLGSIIGSSSTNTILIRANPFVSLPVIITDSATVAADNYVIQFNGASFITVRGVKINGKGASYSRAIDFIGLNDRITIENCVISSLQSTSTSTNHAVIYDNSGAANKSNNISILNNEIKNGSYGIYFYGVSTTDLETGHIVTGNTITDFATYGIRFYYAENSVMSRNTIVSLPVAASSVYGIYNGYSHNSVISRNKIVVSGSSSNYGIYNYFNNGTAASPNMIVNNMVSCLGAATSVYGIYPYNNYYTEVSYNSVNVTGGSATAGRALYINSASTGTYGFVKLTNNNIVSTGLGYAVEVAAASVTLNYISSSNYNNIYGTGTNLVRIGTTNFTTLAAYQTATSMDPNSISANPIYIAADDLHSVSPDLDGAATPLANVLLDFDGDTRNTTTPDIGADEFVAATCVFSTNLGATNITSNGADIFWTSSSGAAKWKVEYGLQNFVPGAGTKITVLNDTTTLAGLLPATWYDFYVQDSCSGSNGMSSWSGPFSFKTMPTPVVVPYTQNFNGTAPLADFMVTDGGDAEAYISTANACNLTTGLLFTGGSASNYTGSSSTATPAQAWSNTTHLASASLFVDATSATSALSLNFDLRQEYSFGPGYSWFRVLVNGVQVSPDYQPATTIADPCVSHTINLLPYAGTQFVLTFESSNKYLINTGAANGDNAYLDNVIISSPSCSVPSSLGVVSVTATTAEVYFTSGGAANYNIEYGATGFTLGAGTRINATNDTITLTSLTPNTTYQFYVRDSCGVNNVSTWAGPMSFSTPCNPYSIPYFEGFESGHTTATAVGGCITQEAISGTIAWTANNTETTYNRGPNSGGWNATLRYGNERWMFIPVDLVGGTSYTFEAYVRQDGAGTANASVTVAYGTLNNSVGMTNTIIPTTGLVNGNYQQIIGNFIPTTSGTYFIGIKGNINSTPWYISIDDISLEVSPSCPAPTGLGATNVMATTADVYWSSTGASNWKVQYGPTGFTLGAGTTVNATNDTTTISGLTAQTTYQFYVKDSCSVNDVSPWAGPFSFTTACAIFPLTFTETVEAASPSLGCWGTNGQWGAATYGGFGTSSRSFVFPCYNISPGSFVLQSPQTAPAPAGATLSFDHAYATYSTEIDSLVVLSSTDGGSTFSVLATLAGGANGPLATAGPSSSPFTPTASQWATFSIAVPVGTNRIRFVGISDYGNNMYIDNITLGTPSVSLTPFTLIAPTNNSRVVVAGAAQSQIVATWHKSNSGASYQWRAFGLSGTTVNNPLVSLASDNSGLDTTLTLTVGQLDAMLASLGVAIGDSITLSWNVKATVGTDSIFGTTAFSLKLVRLGIATPLLVAAPQYSVSPGTTGISGPAGTSTAKYFRAVQVVLPTEYASANISTGDGIRSVGFSLDAAASATVTGVMKVYLQNSTDLTYLKNTTWSDIILPMTLVHSATVTIPGGATEYHMPVNQNYLYTGGSMYLAYEFEQTSTPLTTGLVYRSNTFLPASIRRAQSASAFPAAITGSSAFRLEVLWGVDRPASDLEIVALWAKGKNPLVYGTPEQVSVVVRNNGYIAANKSVSLSISGANTFTGTANVSLATGQTDTVSFTFSATTAGFNSIVASVPTDDIPSNNSITWVQQTTTDTYSYADTTSTGLSSVGYNAGSGLLLVKFNVNGTRSVSAVKMRIGDGVDIVGNTIYAVVVDTSGTIVGQSANYVVTSADLATWKTFTITTPPVITNQAFYAGMAQTTTVGTAGYFPLAFQNEEPTRPGAYYTSALIPAAISPVGGFRLLIDAVVTGQASCPDPTALAVTAECTDAIASWTSGSSSVSSTLQYGPAGFTPGTGTIVANVTSPYTITGLALNTAYDVWVKDSCASGVSSYVGAVSFTTLNRPTAAFTYTASGFGLNVDASTSTGTGPLSYNWSFGDATLGSGVTASHTYTTGGSFTITLVVTNACGSDTLTQTVSNIGLEDYALNTAQLYPNPNTGIFQIVGLPLDGGMIQIEISNVAGAIVYRTKADDERVLIDLSGYAPGVYQVKMINERGVSVKPFVIRN